MSPIDFAIIVAYLVIIFSIGIAFTRRAHQGTESYFLSGRNLPWWIAGTSMVATSFSCDTPLYVTQLVRSEGVWLNWQWWSFAIGGLFSAFFLARLWRRARVITDMELTELRYGSGAGGVLRTFRAGWTALLINTISMSWVVLAMAKIIGVVWGGPKWAGVLAAASLAVSYSFFSGFWGVVVTDLAQFMLAMIGAVALAVFSVQAAGGLDAVLQTAGRETMQLIPTFPAENIFTVQFWSSAFGGFIVYISIQWWANLNSDGGGKVIQRMSAARTEAHAFGATLWYNFAHFALRTWPWVLVALASLVLLPNLQDHELAYPTLILTVLPSPWKGILVAGLFAAFMSTIDTQLNWGASYLTHDVYRNRIAPGRSEKHYLVAAKISMLILIAITSLMAYKVKSVTEAFKFLIAFGAGAGPVYLLRWFWWRINAWSEISAMIASTIITSVLYLFFPAIQFTLKVVFITAGSAVVFLPVTLLSAPVAPEILRQFYKRTHPPGAWRLVRKTILEDSFADDMKPVGESIRADVLGWIGGIALTLGTTLAIGAWLFRFTTAAVSLTAVAILGAAVVLLWMKKAFKGTEQIAG